MPYGEGALPPSHFTPTASLARFFTAPGNRVRVRRRFCVWRLPSGVHGSIAWGKATDEDVIEMCEVFDAVMHSPIAHQPSIMDIRAVESVSVVAFDRLMETLTERRPAWRPRAGRQAILHGATFPAALVLGALQIAAADYPLEVFEHEREAFAWAGAPAAQREVAALRASLLEPPDIVRRVRVALAEHDAPLSLRGLSRSLGVSPRSLQRHLATAGSSVRAERTAHVVARAERLLAGTDLDLAAIAAMLGLSSAGHLVSLFRAERQTTPDAWRRAAR
ncbi:MAG: helix-turn-helix transcriptional regulator [Archangiaceae bacterium]|nr:helix-turn-helix transcriptional regulator [Archangiaceae bacterium]